MTWMEKIRMARWTGDGRLITAVDKVLTEVIQSYHLPNGQYIEANAGCTMITVRADGEIIPYGVTRTGFKYSRDGKMKQTITDPELEVGMQKCVDFIRARVAFVKEHT